jgi:hypothetical protein
MTVYEYGSGGSTLWFSARVARVVSIENDPAWYDRVAVSLRLKCRTNVDLRLVATDLTSVEGFLASDYPGALPPEAADIVVIDGSETEGTHGKLRPICFRVAEDHVKTGGMIIVDDSWRYPALRESTRAKSVEVYRSVGPARIGVTSTDIHFY